MKNNTEQLQAAAEILRKIDFNIDRAFGPSMKSFRKQVLEALKGGKVLSTACGFNLFAETVMQAYFPAQDGGCLAANYRLLQVALEAFAADSIDLNDWLVLYAPETRNAWFYLSDNRRVMELAYVEAFRNPAAQPACRLKDFAA